MENSIKCELCGLICRMQISGSHLRAAHAMTTKEYKALGYKTLSPARLHQLRQTPVAKGLTKRHYGPDHWNWKGGHVTSAGYRVISKCGKHNLYEHRVIAEEMLGRPLRSDEVVHHKDGNRSNNSPDNLVVMTQKQHTRNNEGIKRYFHTGPDCVEASRALHKLGWSKTKISKALRVNYATIQRWLHNEST